MQQQVKPGLRPGSRSRRTPRTHTRYAPDNEKQAIGKLF